MKPNENLNLNSNDTPNTPRPLSASSRKRLQYELSVIEDDIVQTPCNSDTEIE